MMRAQRMVISILNAGFKKDSAQEVVEVKH